MRELWQQSRKALQSAKRISLVGYSLPSADLAMESMVREAVARGDVLVDVVNIDGCRLRGRLIEFGASGENVKLTSGPNCVERFSATLCDIASVKLVRELPEGLADEPHDTPLAVAWGNPDLLGEPVRLVVGLSVREDKTLELALDETPPSSGSLNVRYGSGGPSVPPSLQKVADLIALADSYERIVATVADSEIRIVAGFFHRRRNGISNRWLMFVPAEPTSRDGQADPLTTLAD